MQKKVIFELPPGTVKPGDVIQVTDVVDAKVIGDIVHRPEPHELVVHVDAPPALGVIAAEQIGAGESLG